VVSVEFLFTWNVRGLSVNMLCSLVLFFVGVVSWNGMEWTRKCVFYFVLGSLEWWGFEVYLFSLAPSRERLFSYIFWGLWMRKDAMNQFNLLPSEVLRKISSQPRKRHWNGQLSESKQSCDGFYSRSLLFPTTDIDNLWSECDAASRCGQSRFALGCKVGAERLVIGFIVVA